MSRQSSGLLRRTETFEYESIPVRRLEFEACLHKTLVDGTRSREKRLPQSQRWLTRRSGSSSSAVSRRAVWQPAEALTALDRLRLRPAAFRYIILIGMFSVPYSDI